MEREQLTATVRAAQQGDEKALNLLFNTYYNDVYYFALKTLKDEDLACDITQETFVEIINTLQDLKEPAAFVTWMRQVTYHQCTRYFKKKKEVLVEEDEEGHSVFDTLEEEREEFIPGEGVDKEDFRATILALLDTLSEEQRAAVLMHYYHEMSVKDIAEAQQVSEGTVKSRLNYARKSLKKSVEDYEKKHDVKLHCAGVLPLLLWLFAGAGKEVMPLAAANTVAGGVASATGTSLAVSASGGSAVAATTATAVAGTGLIAKIAALPLAVKIISGITAGLLLIGSVAIVRNELGKSSEPTNPMVMQTKPSGGNNQEENNETTVPSGSMETQPNPTPPGPPAPTAYIVPEGCTYYCADGIVIDAGNKVCVQATEGDRLATQMFEYTYSTDIDGWKAARRVNNTTYEPFHVEINDKPLISLAGIFQGHITLGESPEIPDSVVDLSYAFSGCTSLKTAPTIPDGVMNMEAAFDGCNVLTEVPEIPASVMNMTRTFAGCFLLTGEIVINATPTAFEGCFAPYMGWFGKPIVLTGTGGNLEELAVTSSIGNVTVDPTMLKNEYFNTTNHETEEWEVQPVDSFNDASDEQILACLEFSPAGRTPMNDTPGYTYMNETHVVGTRIDAALDIADVEVLYATVNGAPCEVYQTRNRGKISEIMGYEEWNAETFDCRKLHNVFLVRLDSPIEVTDDRTDYVIVDHTIMFRVYPTNGEYRDVLYEDDHYILSIFGGGLMSEPEWYE